MSVRSRIFLIAGMLLVLAGLAYVGVGIYRAGGSVALPPGAQPMHLSFGTAEGRRVTGRSWTLHYDKIETSLDGTTASIQGLRDGTFYRNGKPFVRIRAKHVVVNTITNDITIDGPVSITTLDSPKRTFSTNAATWNNFAQRLLLPHESTMRSGDALLRIATVAIDFRSGSVKLGRVAGTFRT